MLYETRGRGIWVEHFIFNEQKEVFWAFVFQIPLLHIATGVVCKLFKSSLNANMKRLHWIESAGGPLVIISDNIFKSWSGIYKRNQYLIGIVEEAWDFMDAEETDYGKACSIDNYLGVVKIGVQNALVLGDEPMPTTIFYTSDVQNAIARCYYYGPKDSEHLADEQLSKLDLDSIDNWEFILTIDFGSNKQYLFDAACDGNYLDNNKEKENFLLLELAAGQYKVFTCVYKPNADTKLFLHRLVATN